MQVALQWLSADAPSPPRAVDDVRELFAEYGLFLKETQSCGYFNHDRFVEEIAALPTPYTSRRGGMLVAYHEGVAAACIAYRVSPTEEPEVCEIKRLFVRPLLRGQGLARMLVEWVLEITRTAGYLRVTLDTDVATMPEALELYLKLGFAEYKQRAGTIAFIDRSLA